MEGGEGKIKNKTLKNLKREEKKKMRKTFLTIGLILLSIAFVYGNADAVSDQCSNCHTMHNSQNGTNMTYNNADAPNDFLLRGDCLGCHGQNTSSNIVSLGNVPQVLHKDTTDLAGGNFAYITGDKTRATADASTAGHNVTDLGVADSNLTSGPPGDENTTGITTNLTCAGTMGCHGNRGTAGSMAAIKGAHHANDAVLKFPTVNLAGQGTTVGTSYRFLLGVKGGEDTDWQATSSATDHNEYFGATGTGQESTKTTDPSGTMSGLCAECHGGFHGSADIGGTGSPWQRHPTDISLPGTGTEYAAYTTYSTEAPVARTAITDVSGIVTPTGSTDDIVMCLSCHRAHASPNQDMLRWSYAGMSAGTTGASAGTGCFTCHTTKDGN